MALRIPQLPNSQLFKDGYKHLQGLDEAVFRNINACHELTQIVRTSFGPNGRKKLIINHLEKLFVSSDAGTIMKELEVVHPAAKLLVMASQAQEQEMGDASNLTLILAGELLKKAEYLLKMGLHPSDVVAGYEIAANKTNQLIDELSCWDIKSISNEKDLMKAVKPTIMAKQNGYEDFLTPLIVSACMAVLPRNPREFNVDSVRVVKIMGGSIFDSKMVKGMVFGREPESNCKKVTKAKVAVFSCPLDISQTETKGTVLIHNAEEMLGFSKGEESALESQLNEIAKTGVNVIVTGSGAGDIALHFLNRMNILVLKVLSKFDLRRLCRVIGATPLARIGAPMAEELGQCDIVETVEIGSDRCTVFRQENEATKTATIVLRGGTSNFLDDVERAVDDGVNIVKAAVKNGKFVAGAGACELELARRLNAVGEKTPGIHQYAIKKFSEALEVVPRTLAENAGMDSTNILSKLYAAHQQGQQNVGVDIDNDENGVLDAAEHGIIDSLPVKAWAIQLASNAALTVLRVDQIIMAKQAGGPKAPKDKQNWDED